MPVSLIEFVGALLGHLRSEHGFWWCITWTCHNVPFLPDQPFANAFGGRLGGHGATNFKRNAPSWPTNQANLLDFLHNKFSHPIPPKENFKIIIQRQILTV